MVSHFTRPVLLQSEVCPTPAPLLWLWETGVPVHKAQRSHFTRLGILGEVSRSARSSLCDFCTRFITSHFARLRFAFHPTKVAFSPTLNAFEPTTQSWECALSAFICDVYRSHLRTLIL